VPVTAQEEADDPTESERRHQPELWRTKAVENARPVENEFEIEQDDETEDETIRDRRLSRVMQGVARQVSLDPNDGMDL
jgi:type IV secretion system protein VirD4